MNTLSPTERAVRAQAVLENAAYTDSYDMVRLAIIERIENCPLQDTNTAEDLRRCLRLLRDVRLNLEVALKTGKVINFRMEQDEKARKNPLRGIFR